MDFLAERLGVDVVSVPELQREVSVLHDARSVRHMTTLIRRERPHILHTHTAKAGAIARAAALLAGDCAPADRRPHLSRTRPQGLLRARANGVLPPGGAKPRAQLGRAGGGEPGGAGRARRAPHRTPEQVRGYPPRHPARGSARGPDHGSRLPPAVRHPALGLRDRLGRAHDGRQGHGCRPRDRAGDARARGRRCRVHGRRRARPRAAGAARPRPGHRARATSSATSPTSPATTVSSTRSCSRPSTRERR